MPKPTNESPTEGPLKKVTIRDVAKQAGVSFKTVSRVFNNETTVRPMTREKVLSAAEALNFSPNIFARQLSLGRSNTIGLVIFDFPRWSYYADVIMGVQRECQKHGFSVSVYSLTSASKEQLVTLRLAVLSRSLAGLVLTAPWSSNKRFLAQVDSWDISIACILSDNEDSIHPAVFNNDIEGARVRARYLLSLGHLRFAIAAGDLHQPFVRARLQGTLEELNKAGIKSSDIAILYGDVSFEAGYELGTEIINQPNKPTAILAANDLMAVGIMRRAHEMGVAIPDELSIVGFGDLQVAGQVWPGLTTVSQDTEDMASAAARMLITEGKRDRTSNPHVYFETELLIRESTAKPGR